MTKITSEYYRHKEDHDVVVRVLKDEAGTISVCSDDLEATIFHLTREELDFNFEPIEEDLEAARDSAHPASEEETKT